MAQKNKWGIKDNLFVSKDVLMTEKKILQISAAEVRQHVKVVLKDGVHLCCNLNDFCPGEKSGFTEQYRTSRTQFLQWLGFEEANADSDRNKLRDGNTPDKETECMKQSIAEKEQNALSMYTFDSEYTDGEAKVQVEREECQGSTSLDRTVIKTHLLGSHVKVHIDNLIEPLENLLVRPISQEHVSAIADSFQGSFDHFTTLLGLVDPGCTINSLAEPGAVKVQVLGGNHTRAALQLLRGKTEYRKDKGYEHVIMDVYEGLSEEQCLYVAYSHNEIHEKSRKMTFQEKVAFFHRLLEKKKRSMHNKSPKVTAVSWRADISTFTRKTRDEVKNSYKIHLYLASCSGRTWESIEMVFAAYDKKTIKGQKTDQELTQYPFNHFSKIKVEMDKIHLLTSLASGEISLEEFRKECLASRQSGTAREKDGAKVSKTPLKKSKRKTEECIVDKTREYLEKRLKQAENALLNETEKRKSLENKIRQKEKEIEKLTMYQEKVKEQEKCISILIAKVNQQLESFKYMEETECKIRSELEMMKSRTLLAEDTAARARSQLKEKTSNQTSLKRPRNETDGDETKNQKQKKMESTCMEGKGSEGTEQELAIVEYNHQKFYLGILSDENTFIFCKEPIAKVQKEKFTYNISKMSMKLDLKDKQIIDTGYLVCKFFGHVTKDTISMKTINRESLETQIRNYLK